MKPSTTRIARGAFAIMLGVAALSIVTMGPAHADIATVLQNVITMMNGTVAKSLAIIAVMLTRLCLDVWASRSA